MRCGCERSRVDNISPDEQGAKSFSESTAGPIRPAFLTRSTTRSRPHEEPYSLDSHRSEYICTERFPGLAQADSATRSVEHVSFTASDLEGRIEYPLTYPRTASIVHAHGVTQHNQTFQIYLKVRKASPLFFVDYRDFRFVLRDSTGQRVAQSPSMNLAGSVTPEIPTVWLVPSTRAHIRVS
jgi:hypothetical protein